MTEFDPSAITRSGFVAIVGRPNVGKSTLVNYLVGQKVSIVTSKPHTTRHRILGIATLDDMQIALVDTPGINMSPKRALNQYMNQAANNAAVDADVVLMVVEVDKWGEIEEHLIQQLKQAGRPVILLLNKIDQVKHKEALLPKLQAIGAKHDFAAIVPLSARKGKNVNGLLDELRRLLPEGSLMFPEDQITDKSERFLVSEFIREKIMLELYKELPYVSAVSIEEMGREEGTLFISAAIWVETQGQKAIVIGKKGGQLKSIGERARLEIEREFEEKVFLKTFVKVKDGWSDDKNILQSLGYGWEDEK